MYCNNVENLLKKLGVFEYNSNDWRLLTDRDKISFQHNVTLKCVLQHNGNAFGSKKNTAKLKKKKMIKKIKLKKRKIQPNQISTGKKIHTTNTTDSFVLL